MNTDQLKGRWLQMKGAAKAQWGKLTDDELTQVEGNSDRVVGLIQEKYGFARERAEEEVDRFMNRGEGRDIRA